MPDPSESKRSVEERNSQRAVPASDEFVRAENEDDDGYDPYSDRLPAQEPLFEQDPWA